MTVARPHSEVAADLRNIADRMHAPDKHPLREAAALLAAVAATLPDCPEKCDVGWLYSKHDGSRTMCPSCYGTPTPGKVSLAWLAATWQAVHDESMNERTSMVNGLPVVAYLRSVRPVARAEQ